jgi:hypothetical protein
VRAAFHDWRDALAVATGAAQVTGIRRRVVRDRVALVWRIVEPTPIPAGLGPGHARQACPICAVAA